MQERAGPLDPSANYPDIDLQLFDRQRGRQQVIAPTLTEALGIPAVFRAVSLIAATTATLDLKMYDRDGDEIDPPTTFVRRPCRAWKPGEFWRDSSFALAGYGEAIWMVLERDFDGVPMNIVPVWPAALQSEWDGYQHRWFRQDGPRKVEYDPKNIMQITVLRDPATGRGIGPLQRCGAALSVATEADRWAARFFAGGGVPSIYLNVDNALSDVDAAAIKTAWLNDPPNMPKVGQGITPTLLTINPEQSQLTESRKFTRGEVAVMFGIPGKLLEFAESGSSITYANVGDLATEFVRLCLAPNYLEPFEQAFSDLLPRGTEVKFDVEGFQRADAKTRYEIYDKAIKSQIYDGAYVRELEGIPADAAPAKPKAVTPQLPTQQRPTQLREVV